MPTFIEQIHAKAKTSPCRVVLQEGEDVRIIEAAALATKQGIAQITLLGAPEKIRAIAASASLSLDKINIVDMTKPPNFDDYASTYFELRKAKGLTQDQAVAQMKDPLWYGAMMVRKGLADSFVGGALYTTGDVCRAGIQIIGMQPGLKTLSSFFAMVVPDKSFGKDGVVFFADCAVVIAPDVNQLADIAIATADSYASLTGDTPRVAMLSFSTKGSSSHPSVGKVQAATALAEQKAMERKLDADFDGELQVDAALVPEIAARKLPNSKLGGAANVLIFPDLNAANIASKLARLVGRANAYGHIVLGLDRPAADVSRGSNAHDILGVAGIVGVQSIDYQLLYPGAGAQLPGE